MKKFVDLLDGIARLDYLGNLYEYIGMEGENYIFQCVNNDCYIILSYDKIMTASECDILY